MAKWIEVPAHRILAVGFREFAEGFRTLDENGNEYRGATNFFIAERKSDRRVFRLARFYPRKLPPDIGSSVVFLEEV